MAKMTKVEVSNICTSLLEPIDEKLSNILDTIATKSDLSDMFSKLKVDFQNVLEKELESRDKKIAELEYEIENIRSARLVTQDKLKAVSDKISSLEEKIVTGSQWVNTFPTIDDVPSMSEPTKQTVDFCLLGDSLIRHVQTDRVFDGCSSLECFPGANVKKIRDEFLNLEYDAKNVVLVCGTNQIPHDSPETVVHDLLTLVHDIKFHAPKTKVYLSAILPKIDRSYLSGINAINQQLYDASDLVGFSFIQQPFFSKHGIMNFDLFAPSEKLKVHLSHKGIAQFGKNVKKYISNGY